MLPTRIALPTKVLTILLGSPAAKIFLLGETVRDWFLGLPPRRYCCLLQGATDASLQTYFLEAVPNSSRAINPHSFQFIVYGIEVLISTSNAPLDETGFSPAIFSCDAMRLELRSNQLLDLEHGSLDITLKKLRHVSARTFAQNPMSPLVAFQRASTFAWDVCDSTCQLTAEVKHMCVSLSVESHANAFFEWAANSLAPSKGLEFLRRSTYLRFWPSLTRLSDRTKDWSFLLESVDRLAASPSWECLRDEQRASVQLAVLSSFAAAQGSSRANSRVEHVLRELPIPSSIATRVESLIRAYLRICQSSVLGEIDKMLHRLCPSTANELEVFAAAIGSFSERVDDQINTIKRTSVALGLQNGFPSAFLRGQDLIDVGMKPSPRFSEILDHAYSLQMNGSFGSRTDAILWMELNRDRLEGVGSLPMCFRKRRFATVAPGQ